MSTTHLTIDDYIELLGRPFCRGEEYALFCMDCLDGMRQLPASFVDLTFTSPPYNIGKEYESALPIDHYIDWCRVWMKEVHRLTQPHGAFWLNVGYTSLPGRAKAIPLPYLLWN